MSMADDLTIALECYTERLNEVHIRQPRPPIGFGTSCSSFSYTFRSATKMTVKPRIVYVIGAGLSAGLGFPTVSELLPKMWEHILRAGIADELSKVIRFHHPDFNPARPDSFPNVEQFLSEMEANAQLFDSSRPATGNFTRENLNERKEEFLLELTSWFHQLQAKALNEPPEWLMMLTESMVRDSAQIICLNWDLVLDEILFQDQLSKNSYGFGKSRTAPRLIKPHGSLNWFEQNTGKYLSSERKISLYGSGQSEILAPGETHPPVPLWISARHWY